MGADGGDVVLDPEPPVAGENQPLGHRLELEVHGRPGILRRPLAGVGAARPGGRRRSSTRITFAAPSRRHSRTRRLVASVIESWSSTARAFLNRDRSRSPARVRGPSGRPCQGIGCRVVHVGSFRSRGPSSPAPVGDGALCAGRAQHARPGERHVDPRRGRQRRRRRRDAAGSRARRRRSPLPARPPGTNSARPSNPADLDRAAVALERRRRKVISGLGARRPVFLAGGAPPLDAPIGANLLKPAGPPADPPSRSTRRVGVVAGAAALRAHQRSFPSRRSCAPAAAAVRWPARPG